MDSIQRVDSGDLSRDTMKKAETLALSHSSDLSIVVDNCDADRIVKNFLLAGGNMLRPRHHSGLFEIEKLGGRLLKRIQSIRQERRSNWHRLLRNNIQHDQEGIF